MVSALLTQLDARDRALFVRWAMPRRAGRHRAWFVITHVGGLWCSVAAAGLPLLIGGVVQGAGIHAAVGLVISHGIVQLIKRNVLRERPAVGLGATALVTHPDEFSFPSGHATAAMSVAFMYAVASPAWSVPLLVIAAAVGFSRVRLGVHYPGDVLAGQLIAVLTDVCVLKVM